MQIARRGFQMGVSEQILNHQQVYTLVQQMGRERVAQSLLILLMIYSQRRFAIGIIPSMAWKLKYFAIYVESTMPF
jgi:hypothetical protein